MTWLEEQQETKRLSLESGPGSDRDKPYNYKSPEHWLSIHNWRSLIGLMRMALNGEIGGRDDGKEDEEAEV